MLLSFNPHPTSRLGAAWVSSDMFQSSPISWLGAGGGIHNPGVFQSSPNRSAGCSLPGVCWVMPLFQSSPNLLAGCNQRADPHTVIHRSFNPHPTSWLGVASRTGRYWVCYPVSILTQPLGWVQRPHPSNCCWLTFQSSPNLSAGCRAGAPASGYKRGLVFQSSPNFLIGCNGVAVLEGFNPH